MNSLLKTLFVWQDENGYVFKDTAVISTTQHNSEGDYVARRLANRALFDYWCGMQFTKANDYFCEKFADMAIENGWKLIEIDLTQLEKK